MPTLITTPGAVDANSYATVAEADAYHDTHLYASAWTAASANTKAVALIQATRTLDALYEWAEWRTYETQALAWPRSGLLDAGAMQYLDEDEIPSQLKNATAEFARQLLEANRTADNPVEAQGIASLSAGSVSLTFRDSVVPKVVPDAVSWMLPRWWGSVRGVSILRELERA